MFLAEKSIQPLFAKIFRDTSNMLVDTGFTTRKKESSYGGSEPSNDASKDRTVPRLNDGDIDLELAQLSPVNHNGSHELASLTDEA